MTPQSVAVTPPLTQTGAPRSIVRSGFAALDDLGVLDPGKVTLLDAWGPRAFGTQMGAAEPADPAESILLGLLAGAAAIGRTAVLVDGSNLLDVYRLGRAAERRGVDPEYALQRVRIARGFTAYQLQALIEDSLAQEVTDDVALVAVAGLPVMYMDADVAPAEGRVLARRAVTALRRVAERLDVPAVATSHGFPGVRGARALRQLLHESVDEVVGLQGAGAGDGFVASVPRRGVQVLEHGLGARQSRLPDYASVGVVAPRPEAWSPKPSYPFWMLGHYREGKRKPVIA